MVVGIIGENLTLVSVDADSGGSLEGHSCVALVLFLPHVVFDVNVKLHALANATEVQIDGKG